MSVFTDRIARLYKTQTRERVLSELKKAPNSPKAKAITYGFFLALGKANDMKWKFSQVEIESGEFLLPYIDTLLNSTSPLSLDIFCALPVLSSGTMLNSTEIRSKAASDF